MQTLPLLAVVVPEGRQRKNPKDPKPLEELKRSIIHKGLFHAPVLAALPSPGDGLTHQLIAGERRLLAITELHRDGVEFRYNGAPVPRDALPYVTIADLDAADLLEAEFEENVLRVKLTWQEEMEAKLKIHEARKALNPEHRVVDTAQEIVDRSGPTAPRTVASEKVYLQMASMVAPHAHLPNVASQKSLSKAYAVVLDQEKANLARQLRQLTPKSTPHTIIHGDFFEIHKTLRKNSFDVILCDPPYGIEVHQSGYEKKHHYDDSRAYAVKFYQELLRQGFHLLKPQGHLFMFCDIEHFVTIRTFAESQAFSTFRTPIIWHKGFEGPAPWGKNGFARTYEILLFAAKGQRPLEIGPEPDVKLFKRTSRLERMHAAEKPPELLRWLLQLSTRSGSQVLDPCCGSAPIIPAARDLGITLTCIEQNQEYYSSACQRAMEAEKGEKPVLEDQVSFPFTKDAFEEDIFDE